MDYADYFVHSARTNTYTSNTHYLTDTTKELEAQFETDFVALKTAYKADMKPHFHTVCGLLAFFKTRKKMLPDTIQMHFTKALEDVFQDTEKAIGNQIMSKKIIGMIKESARSVSRRKFHLEREAKIEAALDEISIL